MTLRKAEPTMATQAPVAASTPARLIKPWTLPPQTSYLFKNANVVDTVEGVIRKQTVRLAEGLIQAVGDPAGSHDVVIDLEGKFLCPGLIDCHVHLSAVAGNAIEGRNNPGDDGQGYRISVQLDQGGYRAYDVSSPGDLRIGDRVRLYNGQISRQ